MTLAPSVTAPARRRGFVVLDGGFAWKTGRVAVVDGVAGWSGGGVGDA